MNWKDEPWRCYTNGSGWVRFRQDHSWGIVIITENPDPDSPPHLSHWYQVEFKGINPLPTQPHNYFCSDYMTLAEAMKGLEELLDDVGVLR